MSCLFPPEIIILMYFLILWSRDLLRFSEFSHEILSFSFLVVCGVVFQVFFDVNCCGCTIVCESSKHRLSVPLVEALNGPIDDNNQGQRTKGLWLLLCFGFTYITFP